jgi:hypothetical protein
MLAKPLKLIAKLSIALLCGGALVSCTANSYRKDADQETYEAIEDKTNLVPGMTQRIGIDEAKDVDLSSLPANEDSYEFLDNEADSELGANILSLNIAIAILRLFLQWAVPTTNGIQKINSLPTCRP